MTLHQYDMSCFFSCFSEACRADEVAGAGITTDNWPCLKEGAVKVV